MVSLLSVPAVVHAEQTRDWMVGPQPGGTVLNMDVVFPGFQAQVEHRIPIYGIANELWLKGNALVALPFYESQFDVDLRLVILSLGASVGFRETFRGMQYRPGADIDRENRRGRELRGDTDAYFNGFGEGRITLALPFNDHAVFLGIQGLRYEGGPDEAFDWRLGVVRDSGVYINSNNTLFLKHKDLGAIGPQVQILSFDLEGTRQTQVNYGFTLVTRPGLMKKNDLLFLSMLFNFDKRDKGYSPGDVYGNHLFYTPMTFQLAYRMVFELQPKSIPWDEDEE